MFGGDITLNIMSLGGIALGIGMLVDNSVVVLESIFRHREKGAGFIEAAKEGASEVGTAVTASTLTTIAVFLPLVFVQGIAGQLFRDQALTVTFSLLASLAVALTLIPMLASLGDKNETKKHEFAEEKVKETKKRGKVGRGVMAFFPLHLHHNSHFYHKNRLRDCQKFRKNIRNCHDAFVKSIRTRHAQT